MDGNEIGLVGALGGAIIGGACSVIASIWAHKLESKARKTEDTEKTVSEIKSLRTEIFQVWQIYEDELGAELRELNELEPLMSSLPIGNNPFPFFDSMPACLTKMEPGTVDSIFNWYSRAKGLIRQTQDNNDNISRALKFASEQVIQMQLKQPATFNLEARLDEANRDLVKSYAQRNGMMIDGQALKKLHNELSHKTMSLLGMLDRELEDQSAKLG